MLGSRFLRRNADAHGIFTRAGGGFTRLARWLLTLGSLRLRLVTLAVAVLSGGHGLLVQTCRRAYSIAGFGFFFGIHVGRGYFIMRTWRATIAPFRNHPRYRASRMWARS